MPEPKPFASLSPSLLARKGTARPAMRPQLGPIGADALARQIDDLGWNDMGHDDPAPDPAPAPSAQVVAILPDADIPEAAAEPEVLLSRKGLASLIRRPRRSALAEGRRAAFTLRLDADRHLKLRLACTLHNRSAQQLVTEALDRLLADLPAVANLADQVTRPSHETQ